MSVEPILGAVFGWAQTGRQTQMHEIDLGATKMRTRRILVATGAALMLAFPAASAHAANHAAQQDAGTCVAANANGAAHSGGPASGAATASCPPGGGGA